jgi:Electron transfer DM13
MKNRSRIQQFVVIVLSFCVIVSGLAGAQAGLTALSQGSFYNVEHNGSGKAIVYKLENGALVLRLENLDVLNGPDLHVWLSAATTPKDSVSVGKSKYLDLGKLKGNKGNQNYEIPAGTNLSDFKSVVIWCQPFKVNFSSAALGTAK